MKILDRYLSAVRQSMFLTRAATKNDILRELEEELRAQFDDREKELGRSLTESEADQILQRFGHPLLVAGRYAESSGTLAFGRQLIGPELFPLYRLILTINLSLASIGIAVFLLLTGLPGGFSSFLPQLAIQAAIITGIFIAAEAGVRRSIRRGWSMLGTTEPEDRNRIPRSSSIAELIFTIFFANIWMDLPSSVPGHIANGAQWSPGLVWNHFHSTFFIPVLIVMGVSIAISMVNVVDPVRRATKLWVSALANVMFAGMIGVTLSTNWAVLQAQLAALQAQETMLPLERVSASINLSVAGTLAIFGLVALGQAVYEIYKAGKLKSGSGPRTDQTIPLAAL